MYERRSRKTNRRSFVFGSPLLLALLGVGIVFFILMGVKALADKSPAPTEPDTPVIASTTLSAPDTTAAPSSTSAPETQGPDILPPETEPPIETTTEPAPTEPPQVMTAVDERYFADALFIGDSRTDGLRLYSAPGNSKFYCATSLNIFTVLTKDVDACGYTGLLNLLKGMQFGKIYIMFGINECGYPTSSFASTFRDVVEKIRTYQPEALIYIQSILYVTQNKENKDSVFSTANLKEKNATLMAIAEDMEDVFYLEVNDALNDGTDHLPSEYTNDGVHLKASYYYLWRDYLMAHAIVDGSHPWAPQDENAIEPEGAALEHP